MQIQLRYFAGLREALGLSSEQVTMPCMVATVQDVLAALRQRGGAWSEALADGNAYRVAVDQRMGTLSSLVRPSAEVAFFPPVTGG
jgi:molybdopterin synthase sulfur carrier subunit